MQTDLLDYVIDNKITKLADEIRDAEQVLWLTCEPSKYMRTNEHGDSA